LLGQAQLNGDTDFNGEMMMKKFIAKSLIASGVLLASSANAAMITSWTYVNEAGFLDVNPADVVESGFQPANVLSEDTYKSLEWGQIDPEIGQKSKLSVDSPQTSDTNGLINTVGLNQALEASDFKTGTGIQHDNYPVNGLSSKWLTGATLLDGIRLGAATWDLGDPIAPIMGSGPELEIAFDFFETKNNPESGVCPDGSIPGTDKSSTDYGCDDYFILDSTFASGLSGLVIDPVENALEFSVTFDLAQGAPQAFVDYAAANNLITTYEITTRLSGLEVVTDFCGDGTPPCLALKTEENSTNWLSAGFAIRAVPEPAAIAILALGLLGLGYARQSRKS
jgi:hypothetical protein